MKLNITDRGLCDTFPEFGGSNNQGCSRHFSLFRRSRFHWLGVTGKPEWIVAHAAIVFHCISMSQSCHGKRQPEITTALQLAVESQWYTSTRFVSRITAKTCEAYLYCLMNTNTEVLCYSMEPPFWHRYVIMAAQIIFKLDLPLTVRVSAHCFGVTSPCLCDTFPKFGDLFSHRANSVN